MKTFLIRKYMFAILLLVFWLGYSVVNIKVNGYEIITAIRESFNVSSAKEIAPFIESVDDEINTNLLGRMNFIEGYGYLQKLLDKKEFNNFSYIKDENGMLYYGSIWKASNDDVEEYAKRVKKAFEYAESKGIKTLFVATPFKILPGSGENMEDLPVNNANSRVDTFLMWLSYYNVPYLDLSITMKESGKAQEELFFKTDHHWTPLAALYATQAIVNKIDQLYGDNWDPNDFYLKEDNFNSYIFEQSMLGSFGQKTGVTYSGLDDYNFLWPKYDTNLSWSRNQNKKEETLSGNFTEAFTNPAILQLEKIYTLPINNMYINTISDSDRIVNYNKSDAPSVSVVRDSYFSPVACFMSVVCSEIDMIWSLSDQEDYNVEEFIKNCDSEYLIIEVYPHNFNDEAFNFFKD
ncbi:MAG: alginate O-acetyltransferase AlgX-related protein [Lachnospiraceae bacterium]